jgi:hypothetical protein
MKQDELRAMVRDSHNKPFRVCMDDNRTYTVSHPDFAMVADRVLILASGPGHELGRASFVICYFEHISRIELLKTRSRKAA